MITDDRVAVAAPELAGSAPLPPGSARTVRTLGFGAVELWTPWQVDAATAAGVRDHLDRCGLRVACVSSPSHLYGDEDGRGFRLIENAIEVAVALGATRVNTYFGHGDGGDDRRAADAYAAAVEPLLDRAADAGVVVVLENEFDAFGWDPAHSDITRRAESLHRLVTTVDSPNLRLNLDAANFVCAGQDVAGALGLLAPYVEYVHVKDVVEAHWDEPAPSGWKRYTDGGRAFRTTELGTGSVPWPAVLRELEKAGYDGWFTLEPHCEPELLTAQLRAARSYLTGEPA